MTPRYKAGDAIMYYYSGAMYYGIVVDVTIPYDVVVYVVSHKDGLINLRESFVSVKCDFTDGINRLCEM